VEAQLQLIPGTMVKMEDKNVSSMEKLIDMLEDDDDVQNVYHNWDDD
jgi:transcriptional/translational regulatory protein YebC/TACO1